MSYEEKLMNQVSLGDWHGLSVWKQPLMLQFKSDGLFSIAAGEVQEYI